LEENLMHSGSTTRLWDSGKSGGKWWWGQFGVASYVCR
jgi:hypothetical protein